MASPVVAAAARSEPPSRSVDPSPLSSPDVGDRSDSFNSSANNFSDNEVQDALKSEEYRQLFHLPPEEKVIPLPEVTSVRRAKTAGIFPNAIEIQAGNRKHFFASFLSRDEAFKIINDGWSRHSNGAIVMEQKEAVTESNSQDNGIVAVENVKSSDIPDNAALSTDLSIDAGSPSIVGDTPVLVGDSEMEQHVGELELNNDAPSESWNWNEEDIDAPSRIPDIVIVSDCGKGVWVIDKRNTFTGL
ncbi:hypothetical protein V8G54_009342 [Vigna mungo]|uniref:GRAM domain-containing protein n=1 Tax=Vigna mungo TaxID=3915 RepID=A0AAQ3NVZ2_VIGMU